MARWVGKVRVVAVGWGKVGIRGWECLVLGSRGCLVGCRGGKGR